MGLRRQKTLKMDHPRSVSRLIPLNLGDCTESFSVVTAGSSLQQGSLTFGRQCVHSLSPQRRLCTRILQSENRYTRWQLYSLFPPLYSLACLSCPFSFRGIGFAGVSFLKEWNDVPDFLFHPLSDADSVSFVLEWLTLAWCIDEVV